MLICDLKLEEIAKAYLQDVINDWEQVRDLETQMELIEKTGIQNYLQSYV